MKAMKVFSSAIGYLKDHMWATCEMQLSGIKNSDITWVLTVPAIWNDSSKQFMREAAKKVYYRIFFSDLVFYFKDQKVKCKCNCTYINTKCNCTYIYTNFNRLGSVLIS